MHLTKNATKLILKLPPQFAFFVGFRLILPKINLSSMDYDMLAGSYICTNRLFCFDEIIEL